MPAKIKPKSQSNEDRDAAKTLELLADNTYNAYRPDSRVIEDLLNVVRYLGKRLQYVENSVSRHRKEIKTLTEASHHPLRGKE